MLHNKSVKLQIINLEHKILCKIKDNIYTI